jgi:hypothetical protein
MLLVAMLLRVIIRPWSAAPTCCIAVTSGSDVTRCDRSTSLLLADSFWKQVRDESIVNTVIEEAESIKLDEENKN